MTDYTVYDLLTTQDMGIQAIRNALYKKAQSSTDEIGRVLWLADSNPILENMPLHWVFAVGYLLGRAGLPDEDQSQNDLPVAATAPCPDCGAASCASSSRIGRD